MASKTVSAPRPSVSAWMAATVSGPAIRKSVAPKARAMSPLASWVSMAMMRLAPASFAPMMMLRPTPPAPNTATLLPGRRWAVLSTAPTPVVTAQPMSAATVGGMSLSSTTQHSSGTTVWSAKQARALKW